MKKRNVKSNCMVTRFRVLILVGIFMTLFFGSRLIAFGTSSRSEDRVSKCYTSIQIKSGDTLWSIAQTHMDSEYGKTQEFVNEVKSINRLGSDEIHAGQFLTIPYYAVATE